MIRRIQALYFKGFKYADIYLNQYNVLIGPNASGKSTLLDIFKFLHDVLNESPIAAVESRVASFEELIWKKERDSFEIALEFQLPAQSNGKSKLARYEISFTTNETSGIIIDNEQLWLIQDETLKSKNGKKTHIQKSLFPLEPEPPDHLITQPRRNPQGWRKIVSKSSQGNDYFRSETGKWNITYRFGPQKASLARIPEDESRFPLSIWVKNFLMEGIQFLQLNSRAMRWPCRPDAKTTFEPDGSNLPKVINHLKENHFDAYLRWIEHVKTALVDVKKIEIRERPEDRYLYIVIEYENSLSIPSWLLSDGTLRLLAQTIIAYLPNQNKLYIIEEPENGLHPQAIETVIQSLSSTYDSQIILATHSPVILRLSNLEDILCFSKTESGAIDVIRGSNHPRLKEWKKDVDLATLHAAGVLQ